MNRSRPLVAICLALLAPGLVHGCSLPPKGLPRTMVNTLKHHATEAEPHRIAAEIRRCSKYYPGRSPDSHVVRDGNPSLDRTVEKDGTVVYSFGLYRVLEKTLWNIQSMERTTFELPVDETGRICECRVVTQTYQAEPGQKP